MLREYLDVFCLAYLDDILIYSNSEKEYIEYIKKVLAKLSEVGLYLDINKCEFYVQQVKYLGLMVITKGLKMDPHKVEAVIR